MELIYFMLCLGGLCFAITVIPVMYSLASWVEGETIATVTTVSTMRINQCALIKSSNNMKRVRGFRA